MKKLLSVLIIAVLLFGVLSPALPVSAQDPTEEPVTSDPTEETPPTEEATPEATPTEETPPTVEATPEATTTEETPPTVDATPTEEATPTVEPTVEPTVPITSTVEITPTVELTSTLEAAADLSAQGTFQSTTVFAAQNPNKSSATSMQIQIFNTSGTVVYNDSVTVQPGYAYVLDQASQTLTGFTQGSAILSAGEDMGVTTLIKTTATGVTRRFDTYNGLSGTDLGTTLTFPQVVKNLISLGQRYNTTLAIQNTGGNTANVTVNFKVGSSTVASPNYSIPPNASVFVNSEDVAALGSTFNGYAVVTQSASPQPLAGMSYLRTGETTNAGSLVTLKGFALSLSSADGEVDAGTVYKYISSLGCSYSSGQSIINVGAGAASITVRYKPAPGYGTPITYNQPIATGSSVGIDQRYDPNLASRPTFFGSVSFQVTSGNVVAINNLRGSGCDPTLNVSSVPVEKVAGTKLLVPMVMKNDTSGLFGSGFTWASALTINTESGSSTGIRVTYFPYSGGSPISYLASIPGGSSFSIDQRYDTNLTSSTFRGAMMIESTNGVTKISATTNLRGTGAAADAVASYRALAR